MKKNKEVIGEIFGDEGFLATAIAIEDAGPATAREGLESTFSKKMLRFRGASCRRRAATWRQ